MKALTWDITNPFKYDNHKIERNESKGLNIYVNICYNKIGRAPITISLILIV